MTTPTPDWATSLLGQTEVVRGPGMWHWSTAGEELRILLVRALGALQAEDALLRASFDQNPNKKAYEKVAHGLAYWLFEHNLVFPIFREWIKTHVVLWDEPFRSDERPLAAGGADRERTEEKFFIRKEKARRKFIDLQVELGSTKRTRALFEAKWWVSGLETKILEPDRKALEAAMARAKGCEGYQIVFWYGHMGNYKKDFSIHVRPVFAGMFTTHVWSKATQAADPNGYFAMVVWPVKSS